MLAKVVLTQLRLSWIASFSFNCKQNYSRTNESADKMSVILNGHVEDKVVSNQKSFLHNSEVKKFTLSDNNDNSDIVASCVGILQKGGIIAVPTDTIYGVACLAQCTEAVEKLYALKERSLLKPLAICVGETYDVCHWTRFPKGLIASVSAKLGRKEDRIYQRPDSPDILQGLLKDLLPGPVTIVTERSPALNSNLNPKLSSVGIRVPDQTFVRDLANRLREPLALTSANISGEETSLCVDDFRNLWPKLDAVIDGGVVGSELVDQGINYTKEGSTVVKIMPDGLSFKVLRAGCAYGRTVQKLQKWSLEQVF